MEWLVGMDLSDRGQGALGYAHWLRGLLPSGDDGERFYGVHVLEQDELRQALRYHHLEAIETQAGELAQRVVREVSEEPFLAERKVICGRSAEDALADLAQQPNTRALIIGRQAKRGEKRLVRLGRVARRLLRTLPAPVVVVPPDLRPAAVGAGPVLLAASIEADTTGAAVFARKIAADLCRSLLVLHLVPSDDYLASELIPSGAAGDFFRELREDHERKLQVWMRTHELGDVTHQVHNGPVVDRLVQVARDVGSPLVVCGSRGLGLGMRLFSSSVASDLAAACEIPVAVVPNAEAI